MVAAEFQTKIVDGKIEIPAALRDHFPGDVNGILFAKGSDHDQLAWPSQNRRRWELIAKKVSQELTDEEKQELAQLQPRADEELARVGPRPAEELERLCAQLSQEGCEGEAFRRLHAVDRRTGLG